MSAFETELRERLETRMAELDSERHRIGAALAALGPKQARQRARKASARAPRGRNRESIRKALKRRSLTASELANLTGIGRGTLQSTLTLMRQQGVLVHSNRRWGLA